MILSNLKRVTLVPFYLLFLYTNGQSLLSQYIDEPILVDGKLSESIWHEILQPVNLTQRELYEGRPSKHKTWLGIAHDAHNLYIAIRCEQPYHTITAYELARDFNVLLDDVFYILLDTYHDRRNAFVFYTNPHGARGDYQVFDNGKATNINWNTVWDVKTSIDSVGWSAEIVIPFISLRFESRTDSTVWGINFERNIRYLREQSLWMGWKRDSRLNLVTNAGQIHLSKLPNSRKFTELKPYGISGMGGQLNSENALNWRSLINTGMDINYLFNASYRLNISLNTDFAQIESDRQQVNLTRFPLFFPELREFFLEGQDFFDMGFGGDRIIPFYTRRIGLDSNYQPIPIIAGIRLLGKSKGTTLGAMNIQTAKTNSAIAENFSAFSIRKDLGLQSTVGGMTILRINENYQHTTTGVNFRFSTSQFLGSKNLNVGGALVGTLTSQTPTNTENFAYRFFVQYPNDKFNIFLSTQMAGANFSPKVGLMRREDFNEYFAIINYQPRPNPNGPWKWIRQFIISPGSVTLTRINDGNRLQTFQYSISPIGLETRSGESIYLYATRQAEGIFVPFRIFANTIINPGEYWFTRYSADLSTFRGRKIWISNNYSFGQLFDGHSNDVSMDINVRSSRFIQFTLLNSYSRAIFQQSSFEVLLTSFRIRYAFNPNTFGFILAQYNSATHEYLLNYRLQWIPFPGADFFFIANQTLRPVAERGLITASINVMGKLIWRFVI
ncbi:MAG: DUF5916 domain-containing protein [Thermaurantimonas sp.]|uniref:carbohydrate binding family 9 domain-containing protein n=1 Tax=Thermaurantimonas sp. TaxID=2681568 RepID=UPI00391DE1BE